MLTKTYFSQHLQKIIQLEEKIEQEVSQCSSLITDSDITRFFLLLKKNTIKHKKKFEEIKELLK